MKIKYVLAFFLAILVSSASVAQTSGSRYGMPKGKDYDRFSIGLFGGLNFFQGEFYKDPKDKDKFPNFDLNPLFGLQFGYQMSHSVGLRAKAGYTSFTGEAEEYTFTGGSNIGGVIGGTGSGGTNAILTRQDFETSSIVGSIDFVYTFGNISHLNRNKKFHMNLFAGAGFLTYDTEVKPSNNVDSFPSVLRKADGTAFVLNGGVGFKYQVGKKLDLFLELGYNRGFTDKIDATNKPVTENDGYSSILVGANYIFGKKDKQLEWVNPLEVVYNDIADVKEKIDLLSSDKDKDGVADMFDKDNSTAEGMKVYGDGTAIDSDGDGVSDSKDGDPFSAKGAVVDANGMETDSDFDGVPDSRDLEPNTVKGNMVNFQGITMPKNESMANTFIPSIFFDLNSSAVKTTMHDRFTIVARIMKANPDVNFEIVGNTDITGSETSNDKLGMRRAEAVKNHLIKQYNIDGSRLSVVSKGEKDPLAKSLNPMNRRVDFDVKK